MLQQMRYAVAPLQNCTYFFQAGHVRNLEAMVQMLVDGILKNRDNQLHT